MHLRTVVWQVFLLQLVWMRTVVWQVFLLRLLWTREEQLQVQQLNCPDVKLFSRISWLAFPLLHCVAHALMEGSREAPPVRREAPPCRHGGGEEITVITPVVSLDYFSLGLTDNTTGEGNTPTLVLCDSNTTYTPGLMAPRKGPVPHAVRGVFASFQELGYTRMILKSDDVPLITFLVTAVQKRWAVDNQNFQTQLIPGTSPVDDHESNRAAETSCQGGPEPKRASEAQRGILAFGWNNRRGQMNIWSERELVLLEHGQ